ncbi:hypothetical protein VNO80_18487 [Phaseolus coccineus]|uniref:Uncharacterized protein n=1 Tax=Phaseolus coccineus TaxID=3886 RepID=A0AAN9MEC9_PHACN
MKNRVFTCHKRYNDAKKGFATVSKSPANLNQLITRHDCYAPKVHVILTSVHWRQSIPDTLSSFRRFDPIVFRSMLSSPTLLLQNLQHNVVWVLKKLGKISQQNFFDASEIPLPIKLTIVKETHEPTSVYSKKKRHHGMPGSLTAIKVKLVAQLETMQVTAGTCLELFSFARRFLTGTKHVLRRESAGVIFC